MRTAALALILSSFLAILSGCVTYVENMRAAPSFTYASVAADGMAVGGVTSSFTNLDARRGAEYSNLLYHSFIEERKDIYVLGQPVTEGMTGPHLLRQALDSFRAKGFVESATLWDIRQRLTGARFLIVASFAGDDTRRNRDLTIDKTKDKNDKNKEIEVRKARYNVHRSVTVDMAIYDLALGTEAWGGRVTKSHTNTKEYSHTAYNGYFPAFGPLADYEFSHGVNYYPDSPRLDDLLRRAFAGFAENMPAEKK
ncbi:MAG: hypothetical protein HZB29_12880 [Nitrospinae bacterium]|nr:hypothetical protein [Nitrospinota bacterium]